ncbi:MAG TPA: hypothetical protein VNT53_00385 [Pseudolysinimonas sp.]|nr:hypothetical protein [Pseudolysinimonas sp.]
MADFDDIINPDRDKSADAPADATQAFRRPRAGAPEPPPVTPVAGIEIFDEGYEGFDDSGFDDPSSSAVTQRFDATAAAAAGAGAGAGAGAAPVANNAPTVAYSSAAPAPVASAAPLGANTGGGGRVPPGPAPKSARPPWLIPLIAVGAVLLIAIIVVAILLATRGSAVEPENSPSPTASLSPTPSRTPSVSPTPSASPTPTPTPSVTVAPPKDTTKPTLNVPQGEEAWDPSVVCGSAGKARATVTATDNVGVANVTAVSSLAGTTVTLVSRSDPTFVFEFTGTAVDPDSAVEATVTFTATDAAGNAVTSSNTINVSCA